MLLIYGEDSHSLSKLINNGNGLCPLSRPPAYTYKLVFIFRDSNPFFSFMMLILVDAIIINRESSKEIKVSFLARLQGIF